jgi:Leucine-rich repeat (LRR) protein
MKLTPEQRHVARAILEHPDQGLVALTRIAGLDPATAWIGADLRGVLCTDDVSGFTFRDADLRGADFRRARGKTPAMFEGALVDVGTRGVPRSRPNQPPPDLDLERAKEMVLAGQAVPHGWRPFIAELNLIGSGIGDLTLLAELTALQTLWLDDTQVSDVTLLAELTALQTLSLDGTGVSDVTPLAGLTALQTLSLDGTRVGDVRPLAGLTALQTLSLDGTRVSDVTPLAGLTALHALSLDGTLVSDVTPLGGLTALQTLMLHGTQVSDVTPLAGLPHLTIHGPSADARKRSKNRRRRARRLGLRALTTVQP